MTLTYLFWCLLFLNSKLFDYSSCCPCILTWIRCSRYSWDLEKVLLLYSISWHSFCCQFMWQTFIWWDATCRTFPEFPDFLFSIAYVLTCTHIYIYAHTHFKLLFLSTLFSLLKFCTIWKHWLVSTVMSCLKALPSGETRKYPYSSKRVSESIYWPISLLPCSYWAYHRHTMQGWPAKWFQVCGNVEWL